MHACRLQCGPARLAGRRAKASAGRRTVFPKCAHVALLFRGHLKEGAQKSNEGAQELKGGAQASKGGAAPRYVALANSLVTSELQCSFRKCCEEKALR